MDEFMDEFISGWLARAIVQCNPRLTVGLANSKVYRIKDLDRRLDTGPMVDKPAVSVN